MHGEALSILHIVWNIICLDLTFLRYHDVSMVTQSIHIKGLVTRSRGPLDILASFIDG